jgi:hypothetical protein
VNKKGAFKGKLSHGLEKANVVELKVGKDRGSRNNQRRGRKMEARGLLQTKGLSRGKEGAG